MRNTQKTKSRAKLYDLANGTKEITGAAGALATGSIQFLDTAVDTETVTIGGIWFQFDSTGEAAGTSEGTQADPHLVDQGGTVITTADNLATRILEETATTGAWGYLYPDDSVGCLSDGVNKVTLKFWPGAWANSITLAGSAGDETIVQPTGGVNAPTISTSVKTNVIDTTGSASPKEYYVLNDGDQIGDRASVFIKTAEGTDTPTIVGHLAEGETANVEASFDDAAGGKILDLIWDGTNWVNINELGPITFTASA